MKRFVAIFILLCFSSFLYAEDGHQLWLRAHNTGTVRVQPHRRSSLLNLAEHELRTGWRGKPGAVVQFNVKPDKDIKGDGFKLECGRITARTEAGILYGAFDLMRRQQTGQSTITIATNPSYERRILNHWDNLNGSIERGYAGRSIFWRNEKDSLTVTDADRTLWREYGRANASVGINGAVLNNVNASPLILSVAYLKKAKAIADVLRTYGIKVYLSVNFASPTRLGGPSTADPLNPAVAQWWQAKAKEIYRMIPDFGGFLIKANSEGQPGPQNYGRSHADGANMIADALKPFGGIVMWRAFVYSSTNKDRAGQAYQEFVPFDGKFHDNVIVQVKNGPVDFQPREPFSPLLGALKKTPLMLEFQITQEYLGQSNHLVFLSTMWEECLKSDTYQAGVGSTVARCTDGSVYPQKITAIAGVANIGLDTNWCGHHFAQANWYAFGRLAWNPELTSAQIADEWIRLTFADYDTQSGSQKMARWEQEFLKPVKGMMLESREAAVNYMMPLGLHHLFSAYEHYGPGPWFAPKNVRPDWTPPYYHKADSAGIGFDRTIQGSNSVSQYSEPLRSRLANVQTCPDEYILWFHHLPWDFKTKRGVTLWDDICYHYDKGVKQTAGFQTLWNTLQEYVDTQRFIHTQAKLQRQHLDAQVWKDACLLYFQQFSKRPFPSDVIPPIYQLEYLMHTDPRRITE
ncbi:alpha-glucuronidase [Mucilaginibacter lacusdianchii]|uniref:alpha-glucuronidase n=1 Tax=Mucilaginibacter lacusdianchii TaxID=2684211 RepID=UPI0018EF32B6|nr:alpha-glucuronidase [Mucilaginibacter sp. JXJ CY 39]